MQRINPVAIVFARNHMHILNLSACEVDSRTDKTAGEVPRGGHTCAESAP